MNSKKYPHSYNARTIIQHKEMENKLHAENNRLRSQIAQIKKLYANLEEQVNHDPLTGTYNRRYMESLLTQEYPLEKQKTNPLSIAMIDLDNLKKLNDGFGHAIGDMALKILGEKLGEMTRPEDIVCRYGGDEFIVFLHNVNTETAHKRAEEWRRGMEESPITYQGAQIRLTITAGIATHKIHADTIEGTIKAADEALYWAKNMGRNHVTIADNINVILHSLSHDFLTAAQQEFCK